MVEGVYNGRMRLILLAALCAAAVSAQAPATAKPAHPAPAIETKHLSIDTSASAATVAPGGKLTLYVDVTPKPKMHVYAPPQELYLPVALTLDPPAAVTAAAPAFPPGEHFFFAPLKEDQLVYMKPFRIGDDVTVAPSAKPGPVTIKASLRYQACDDEVCYIPQTVPLRWTVTIQR